ncbi:PREDICTED: uncharacterized protein LOC107071423 isoform X1 [Polistes dominula]|uniref:Uncharacterized protein LOC107071423 isoform X1 n=1 Tax=Polistes dominula TaxID=743375 RepID=A0ABM1J0B5_POLDO|nr:PREDICTED: uncharacterized protein LOC107071423 isoform X1 [Polistes dominula]
MESAIVHLEQSVQKADGKLDMIAWQIDAFEKEFEDPDNEISVVRLLRSVHQVTKDYQNLRQEISEVQQLQKQLSDSLKAQLSQVHEINADLCPCKCQASMSPPCCTCQEYERTPRSNDLLLICRSSKESSNSKL